jgi:RecA/RadA recombinase
VAIYLDVESGYSPGLASDIIGLDLNPPLWMYNQARNAESCLKLLEWFISRSMGTEYPVVIIVDSIACLTPAAVIESDLDNDPRIAAMASLWSRFFGRDATYEMLGEKIFLVFINQVRAQLSMNRFDPRPRPLEDYNTPGGLSLKHAYCVRVQVQRRSLITDKDKMTIGNLVEAKTVKNKTSGFPREVQYKFYTHLLREVRGIDNGMSNLAYLIKKGAIKPSSPGWYSYEGKNHREEDIARKYHSDPGFEREIIDQVIAIYHREVGIIPS